MVRLSATIKVIGILLMVFSLSMLPPMGVSLYYHDGALISFTLSLILTVLAGFALWFPYRHSHAELKTRDGFLIVALFWSVLSVFGALPMFFDFFPHLSFVDSYFESVSGLTTTGATVLTHIESLPRAILYYRQQLHLLGGMGIIVLAVAILPMLGIGGLQLCKAETVGPIKNSKLKPRMAESAKALWYIYAGLVVICALCYWAAGMDLFDAIGESFSTLSTGGFSMHDTSFQFYHSSVIQIIAIVFMMLGATNFGLHFMFMRSGRLKIYSHDPELRAYFKILAVFIIICIVMLLLHHHKYHGDYLLQSIFTVVSVSTTTGFTTTNFSLWPTFVPYMLMFVALLGGCSGSTSGGLKVIRSLLLKEQSKRELKRLIHPQAVFSIKLGSHILSEKVVEAIWGFVSVFVLLFIVMLLLLMATGLDLQTAFSALAACFSNAGAAIGKVHSNYDQIPTASKWILVFAMLAGRLEIFTLLILFTPDYWRK